MPGLTDIADDRLTAALTEWLPHQRWYAAKGTAIVDLRIARRGVFAATPAFSAEHLLVDVDLGDGRFQTYQVPLGWRADIVADLEPWSLPLDAPGVTYDGLRDPDIISLYADALAAGDPAGGVDFRTVPGSVVPTGLRGRVLGAEQSNTSVILGNELLLKLFRQVPPGISPDVELHRALAAAGCEYVAPLRGWMEAQVGGEPTTLGMAQDFAAGSAEGWTSALASVEELFEVSDSAASELSLDFAGESFRLGAAVAHVHADLARELGTAERSVESSAVDEILARIDVASAVVPALAEFIPAARTLIEEAEATGNATIQRIHGDLHLGQVLGTPSRWLLIDFEGEPAKTLDERRRMDSPLRDVAGMLRSYDYAANSALTGAPADDARDARAAEWVERNSGAFCDGYASVAGDDPREHSALLRAYELDKAVYEAIYEARNRPTWLEIPMRAIRRLVRP